MDGATNRIPLTPDLVDPDSRTPRKHYVLWIWIPVLSQIEPDPLLKILSIYLQFFFIIILTIFLSSIIRFSN